MMSYRGSSSGRNEDFWVNIAENAFSQGNQPGQEKDHQRDWTMNPILASSTVLFTILFSLVFGIASGYVVISGILHAFAHKNAMEKAPATAVIVTAASSH
ncbi:MAG TPA: hypothetical protein VHA06_03115 [Candidatus Angelobacter sp.]|jgi:hypothetical protein|nr:hypothetical protein [Candidatus Angelobacter sp.]